MNSCDEVVKPGGLHTREPVRASQCYLGDHENHNSIPESLEAATLPIRGQQRFKSYLECGKSAFTNTDVAGEWHRSLVGELKNRAGPIILFNPYV